MVGERKSERAHASRPVWKQLLLGRLPLESETAVFILVNVLDFFMTYWLMMTTAFHERNPVAAWFLDNWGPIKGMLSYKLGMVTFVCLIAQIIALKELQTAQRLLQFATLIVGCVVFYSVVLYMRHV